MHGYKKPQMRLEIESIDIKNVQEESKTQPTERCNILHSNCQSSTPILNMTNHLPWNADGSNGLV